MYVTVANDTARGTRQTQQLTMKSFVTLIITKAYHNCVIASSDRSLHVNASRKARPQCNHHSLHPATKRTAQLEIVRGHSMYDRFHRILRIQSCESRSWQMTDSCCSHSRRFSQRQQDSSTADDTARNHACHFKPLLLNRGYQPGVAAKGAPEGQQPTAPI